MARHDPREIIEELKDVGGMTNQEDVGWVRPEAVTHQAEAIRIASLGEVTAPKIDQGAPVGIGDFVYIDISSVDNKLKRVTEPKKLAIAAAPSRAKQRLKVGDVLVSMTRSPRRNRSRTRPPRRP